jgi:DNA-binding response OmpR family regulator
MARILVAEDDPKQAELIRRYAVADGHVVTGVGDGGEALSSVRADQPALLILDVMMPAVDGHDVCRLLRAAPESAALPILMLTARASEDDLLTGLDLGADDYLTKPFSPRELMARARALLRRTRARATEPVRPPLRAGDLAIEFAGREVTFRGRAVECTPGEFALLELLASEPGRVFTRDQVLRHVHGTEEHVSRRTVDVHVANLRKKLDPDLVRTVYGVGYAFAP